MSPRLTIIKAEKPAPRKRGPQPGAKYKGTTWHACPICATRFQGRLDAIYCSRRHENLAATRRYQERKRNAATAKTA